MKRNRIPAALALTLAVALSSSAFAGDVGFEEDFALAPDRAATLTQLIPGTEDFYYYTALNQQNNNQLDKADATIAAWIKQLGRTNRAVEMENRQALLKYKDANQPSLDYLTRFLNLQFNQEKETQARQAALPTALNPDDISFKTLAARAFADNPQTLAGFEPAALDSLDAAKLSPERLHELLSRLTRPDYANLPDLIAADLKSKYGTGFGSLTIHHNLLLAQLDALLKLRPELLNDSNFDLTYCSKLRPPVGTDLAHDPKAMQNYLDQLWAFVSRLGPNENSLKANVLYQRLTFDRKQNVWDKDRFLAYLALPRQVWYMNPLYMEKRSRSDYPANLNANFSSAIIFPPIREDEPLVHSYLLHLLADAKGVDDYKPFLESTYLTEMFAESKLLSGIGDQDKFAAMLPAAKLQALKDRVDIDFAYTNPDLFAPDDKVALTVSIKNVKTLIVKTYEINEANYYKTFKREVNTDINLDGLVANQEQTVEYTDPPLRRIDHEFKFDNLKARGVYVVEFIGNGKSSRALIRKGKLRYLERESAGGQIFNVLDESNKKIPDAKIWMAGHEYSADKDGDIAVPFSTNPTQEPIVLESGDFASLDSFYHQSETYHLEAGIHVARESLLKYDSATVLIRPALFINSTLTSPKLLEQVTLSISSTDEDGISATKEIPDFKLLEDQPSPYEFQIPDRLKSITFTLRAKVQNVSLNKKDDLTVSRTFTINEIDATDKIADLHLSKINGEYFIDVLGKTGEQRPDLPVQLMLKHHDFNQPVYVTLKSDAAGRIKLGALADIDTLTATDPEGTARTWHPAKDLHTLAPTLNGLVGETLHIPYMGAATTPDRAAFSLLEVNSAGTYVADQLESLTVKDGFLELKGLPAGDFDLLLKETQQNIAIHIAPGTIADGWVLSPTRFLQIKNREPLQIVSAKADANNVTIQLANTGKLTRVQVIATRFVPDFSPFADLVIDGPITQLRPLASQESVYESGRSIGDEYRYILDRKYASKYPGNMLDRPGILLNPWAIHPTTTGQQEAQKGTDYAGIPPAAPAATVDYLKKGQDRSTYETVIMPGLSDDLDFLAEPASVILNLTPDDKGLITIPRKSLGSHQQFHIVALDPYNTVYREISIPQPDQKIRDLRMAIALDPAKHFAEQKQITILQKGDTISLSESSGTTLESYDTLAKVFRLYSTLHPDATLNEFSFILNWPTMKDADKREKYSKYACHELNFFLSRKDPAFFQTVILPYLANKKDKTFMDHFLLGDDLTAYESPWAYARLNVVEQILLGQKIAAEKAQVARHLKDTFDLLPPDIERFNLQFQTAIFSGTLSQPSNGSMATSAPVVTGNVGGLFTDAPAGLRAANDATAEAKGGIAAATSGGRGGGGEANNQLQKKSAQLAKTLEKSASESDGAFKDEIQDDKRRKDLRQLYRSPDKTMEYVENNYYHLPIEIQLADLIKINGFWNDLAQQKPGDPFLSKNVAEPTSNFTEIMFALSVLDLPFDAPAHTTKRDNGTFTLTAAGPIIAFHKEIKEAQPAADKTPILVSQNYFRQSDRYTFVDNERTDKYVTDEFLTQVVYGCQVVITNPTSSRQKLDALLQLPKGAMPVLNAQYSKGLHLDLQPFETKAVEYAFYFPSAGNFPHYPVQVAKNEKILAFAQPDTLKVVAEPSKIDTTSWDYISQNGTADQVFAYLNANNLERTNLEKIAWRMKDKDFYTKTIALLRDRHVYNNTLWSFSIKQNDPDNINQFLQHQDGFVNQCGEYLNSPLLTINPVARYAYQHMEYMPLVNARAHRLGQDRQILNQQFYQQYENTLAVLRYHPTLTDDDLMAVTYYLLLQDRVDDGLKFFKQINPKNLQEKLQYDYFACYTAFYSDTPGSARPIAQQYADYPVDRWKNLFSNVLAQLDEIEGKAPVIVNKEDRNQQQTALAATEPSFEFRVDSKNILLTSKNIPEVKINYYLMDIELMFSQNPFLQEQGGGGGANQFSMIKPNETAIVPIDPTKPNPTIPLPDKYLTQNVMIEITAAGQTKSQAYYANSLDINLAENYGQLTVLSTKTQKPLPKAYVKVYAKLINGQTRFYKDGYTDPRGKFDYTSLSTDELNNVSAFSLLILTDTDGGIVRTANPPKR